MDVFSKIGFGTFMNIRWKQGQDIGICKMRCQARALSLRFYKQASKTGLSFDLRNILFLSNFNGINYAEVQNTINFMVLFQSKVFKVFFYALDNLGQV